ncbi:MAG: mechanosensitive ion channel protein MscS [Candidatus Cloacimonas sp. 4484_275]|nr:MAG: mechanosensitive ion channel protein MscS [Candidatus Cloacimonas sp. 4484_275]
MDLSVIQNWFKVNYTLAQIIAFIGIFLVSGLVHIILRKIILNLFEKFSRKTKTKWDDMLVKHKVFRKLLVIIPLLMFYYFSFLFPSVQEFVRRISLSLTVLFGLFAFSAFLNALNDIYLMTKHSGSRPIKGYLQIISIFFFIMGAIVIIGILLGKSPWLLVSGLGAMTAVILLIFKDTILSFVASLQISFNDLIKIGDWLSVPQYNADGTVIDVALHSIKIQNWDKTITTIPTHKLVEDSFKNWRGMEIAGGRRIKRAVYIDIASIKFCDDKLLKRFEKYHLISDYIKFKVKEIEEYNKKNKIDTSILINGRRLTNIGTFRAYISAYLQNHPKIRKDMTFLIRQLPPGPTGLPLEIYVFTSDIVWANYEAIQADIFDHILAAVPEFDLRVFQNPTGYDFVVGLRR